MRRTLTLARSMTAYESERWAWLEVERAAMKVLSEVDLLGRTDHPALQEIARMGPALSPGTYVGGLAEAVPASAKEEDSEGSRSPTISRESATG